MSVAHPSVINPLGILVMVDHYVLVRQTACSLLFVAPIFRYTSVITADLRVGPRRGLTNVIVCRSVGTTRSRSGTQDSSSHLGNIPISERNFRGRFRRSQQIVKYKSATDNRRHRAWLKGGTNHCGASDVSWRLNCIKANRIQASDMFPPNLTRTEHRIVAFDISLRRLQYLLIHVKLQFTKVNSLPAVCSPTDNGTQHP
jgi:hypothetical protein